jgi:hypothetical protein
METIKQRRRGRSRGRLRVSGGVKSPRLSRHQKTIRLLTGLVLVIIVLATIYIFWNLNVKPSAPG